MKNKIFALGAAALLSVTTIAAQTSRSGYFLDNFNYGYDLNPAFGNDMNFVSIPGVGNLNVAMRGNLHVKDLIHSVDGKTVLFTNPGVSDSFLKDIPGTGKMGVDTKITILAGGWKAWGGYNTVSINARAYADLGVPKEFFRLAKEGISNDTYSISDMYAKANGYAEIALNHSRDIKQVPGLRVGAAMKFLLGMAYAEAQFHQAELQLGTNEWIARTNADAYMSLGKMKFKTKINDDGESYVDGVDMDGVGVNGFGMSFDLGAKYKFRDFDFSLAVLDLGWISYSDTHKASTNGMREVNTDAYLFSATEDITDASGNVIENPNSFENEWDRLSDDLDKLYQLSDMGKGSRTVGLGATLNVGVKYTLPYYRGLSFGLLNTTRILSGATWNETRISANVQPVKCFAASVNGVFGTYGAGFGWLLNYYGKGFTVFLGMDNTLGKVSKEFVPLNSNASVNFGMSIPF